MANDEHVRLLLKEGVAAWNVWRDENPNLRPDLSDEYLSEENLREANLRETNLRGAILRETNLGGAKLIQANLRGADLQGANLSGANLHLAFLREANLRLANLRGAHLWTADLARADLRDANLQEAEFRWAMLQEANLQGANLIGADLREANLSGAEFYRAPLFESEGDVNLSKANLSGAKLSHPDLRGVDLSGANLQEANLEGANLRKANLRGAHLWKADLREADLREADLRETNLGAAKLIEANLRGADLIGANLSGANLGGAQLIDTDLTDANVTSCRIFGVSAWRLTLEGAKQQDLIITRADEPEITVDNIEVAQFVYLMLHNEKIRDVIDTITSKAVLILGRFTEERKKVLDALRDELRNRNLLPILFDFTIPASRDVTETIKTLASLARFVIADVTDATEVRVELHNIVPDFTTLPIQLILLRGRAEFVSLSHLTKFPWVLPIFEYDDPKHLLASLEKSIISPAENAARKLRS
jgi:uncharacterized protein YjbI with pentapeptide repeats